MIDAPKRMTKKAVAEFEAKVMEAALEICYRHNVTGKIKVKAVKGNHRNFASVQIVNPTATAREHYGVAQDFKAEGFGNAMIFGIKNGQFTTFPMFYPLSPDVETIKGDNL